MEVGQGELSLVGIHRLWCPFPCWEVEYLWSMFSDGMVVTKRSGLISGLCSGISGGERIKPNSLWERSPHDLLGSWTAHHSSPPLPDDLPPPTSSLPQEPTFPQLCVGHAPDSRDLGGWGQLLCSEWVLVALSEESGNTGKLGCGGHIWGSRHAASVDHWTGTGMDSKSPLQTLWPTGATHVNHTTGACCILWQWQLLVNSVILGPSSGVGYVMWARGKTLDYEHSWLMVKPQEILCLSFKIPAAPHHHPFWNLVVEREGSSKKVYSRGQAES